MPGGDVRTRSFWAAISLSVAIFAATSARGADIRLTDYDAARGQGYVYIHGSIEPGDAIRFLNISVWLRQTYPGSHIAVVSLVSAGGNLLEASRLAGMIEGERALVMVAPGNLCASACVLLLAAGRGKIVDDTATIEVHSPGMPDGSENSASYAAATEVARIYAEFGVPANVIGEMVTTPPNSVYRLTVNDLTDMGVRVTHFDWNKP